MRRLLCLVVLLVGCGDDGTTPLPDTPIVDDDAEAVPITVLLTLEDQPTNAAMFEFVVAFQDGDGAFVVADPPTGDQYSFLVHGGHWGYAWTCREPMGVLAATPDVRFVQVGLYTVASTQITDRIPARCHEPATTFALTGTVSNIPVGGATPNIVATFGSVSVTVNPAGGAYTMLVPAGTHDLVVSRINSPTATDDLVVQSTIVRDLAVTANTTQNVDFSTVANSQTFPITVNTTGNQRAITATNLRTGNDTVLQMVTDSNAALETNSFAAAQTLATDVFDTIVTIAAAGAVEVTSTASNTPAAMTIDPPAPLGGATATVAATTPYITVSSTWQSYPDAVGYHWTAIQQLTNKTDCGGISATCTVSWAADVSAARLGATTQFSMPDLSAVTGWTVAHQFVGGTAINGTAAAITSTAGAGDFPLQPPAVGTTRTNVRSGWSTTP